MGGRFRWRVPARTRRRLLVPLFWCAVVFALVMALLPRPPHLPGDPSDKVQHILAFAVLTGMALAAFGRAAQARIAVGLFGYGASIELLQLIPILHRDASGWDWLADCAAVLSVLLAAGAAAQLNRRLE